MKKNIIIAAVLMLTCLHNVSAQESAQVKANVVRNFETKFSEATSVHWTPQLNGIFLAQFRLGNESWVAYYSIEGNLVTSGRKIKSADQLPIKVKEALGATQSKYESKFGALLFGSIFEMTNDNGTEYYIPLENAQLSMMVSIDNNGSLSLRKKDHRAAPSKPDPTAIAKKN